MQTVLFSFLGIIAEGTDTTVISLKSNIERILKNTTSSASTTLEGNLLIVRLTDSDLNIYVTLVNNNPDDLAEWRELAENFELPFNLNHINKLKYQKLFSELVNNGWPEHGSFYDVGLIILEEIEKLNCENIITIPSLAT